MIAFLSFFQQQTTIKNLVFQGHLTLIISKSRLNKAY